MALIRAAQNPQFNLSDKDFSSAGRGRIKRPQIPLLVSTNPSSVNLNDLSHLFKSCNHSSHRFPALIGGSGGKVEAVDAGKLGVALSHSSVVVSVFCREVDGGGGEGGGDGLWGRVTAAAAPITRKNGQLVGFGRAVSDLGLTASIYDVMVIPSLRRMGIGRLIVQRIVRMLTNRGVYDIAALCSETERLFFNACGFGDDILGATTMMYDNTASSATEADLIAKAGRKLLVAPPSQGSIQVGKCC